MATHILNLFPASSLACSSCNCTLLEVTNLRKNKQHGENLQRLATMVSKETRRPTSVYKSGGKIFLATTAKAEKVKPEWQLVPDVVVLTATGESLSLDFSDLRPGQIELALNLLRFNIRTALKNQTALWNDTANSFYLREPETGRGAADVLDGFFFQLHYLGNGKIYLSIDPTVKYVDQTSLAEHLKNGGRFKDFASQHFVYRNWLDWYRVQVKGLTDNSIARQLFAHDKLKQTFNVYDWTAKQRRAKGGEEVPDYIENLDPDSPSVIYTYPNDSKEFYGAAALCFKTFHPDSPRVRGLHGRSLFSPAKRLEKSVELIEKYFQKIRFENGATFSISPKPLEKFAESFSIPDLVYANDKVLHVRRNGESNGSNGRGVALTEYGRKRMDFLHKQIGGILVQEPFPKQYLIAPASLHRDITEEVKGEVIGQIQKVYPHRYHITPLVYDDSSARNLTQQVAAIERVIEKNNVDGGSALLILPENAHPDLHNYIKRKLFKTLSFQCATASSLKRFFVPRNGNGNGGGSRGGYKLDDRQTGKFVSYIRYTAIGLLLVNHKWLFALKNPLHYDLPIGIDVLNGVAGFTYAYNGGKDSFFRHSQSAQSEKLSKRQVQSVYYEDLKRDLPKLQIKPRAIIQQRDGNSYAEEVEGAEAAIRRLQSEGFLDEDIIFGAIKIHKMSSSQLRLYEEHQGIVRNPKIGSYFVLNERQGIVCNTGFPFKFNGTVKPLLVTIVSGDLEIEKVLEDIFALAQLAWTAPDKCSRNPVTTKLGDLFLRPIASESDDETALYGEEENGVEEEEELEFEGVGVSASAS